MVLLESKNKDRFAYMLWKGMDFMDNLMFGLNSTIPLFFIMVMGYILYQKKFLTEDFVSVANKFVYYISLPAMLFHDLSTSDIHSSFDAAYVGFCAFATVSSICVIWVGCRIFLKDKTMTGEFVQACYRSSAAILGTAFIQNIYGTSGMSGMMVLGSVPLYNIFAVLILTIETPEGKRAEVSMREKILICIKKIFRNPTLIAIALGLFASFIRLPIPLMIQKTMNSIGSMTSPLALLAIGAGFKGRSALAKLKHTALATLIKLVILPGVFLPMAVQLGFGDQKLVALLVMLGSITTPSAYVMAKQMGHEGTLTGSVCAATTVLSAVTLTFWLFWAKSNGFII